MPSSFERGLTTMTITTPYPTLLYLREDFCPTSCACHPSTYRELFTTSNVIELQDYGICFAAIYARVAL
jgi:hypothetical protein